MAAAAAWGLALAACDTPPQIVDISPSRNAAQVASSAPVRIQFDRPVDRASVGGRFSVSPGVTGTVTWPSSSQLVFTHAPFRAQTTYTVRLAAGYRDLQGHSNQLAHGWSFITEPPPTVTGSTPGPREQDVDPALFLSLQFSRAMDLASLQRAVSLSPSVPIIVRRDPADGRRAIVAPLSLLEPAAPYSLTVTPEARDVDGNPLASGISLDFETGAARPLRHWVTFAAAQGPTANGIWIVDQNQIPRQIAPLGGDGFVWSPDGRRLLVRSAGNVWSDFDLGGDRSLLPFTAEWADFLAPGLGYVYRSEGRLMIQPPASAAYEVDAGVRSAAVSPDGERLAYVARGGQEVLGYAVELRSHYRIAAEAAAVDALAWAPDASRLAYRVAAAGGNGERLRVRGLLAAGDAVTVAIGALDAPRWQADGRHLVFSATVDVDGAPQSRAFRIGISDAASVPLTAELSIPNPPGVAIRDPVPSPDGHQLAFLHPTAGGDQVAVMNIDGTGLAGLTAFDPTAFPYSCIAPAWTRA